MWGRERSSWARIWTHSLAPCLHDLYHFILQAKGGGGMSHAATYIPKARPGNFLVYPFINKILLSNFIFFNENYVLNIKKDESLWTIKLMTCGLISCVYHSCLMMAEQKAEWRQGPSHTTGEQPACWQTSCQFVPVMEICWPMSLIIFYSLQGILDHY